MLLFFDTTLAQTTLGITDEQGGIVAQERCESNYRHAEDLLYALEQMMKAHDIKSEQFKAIILTLGPGSYTGIRVGIAAAKGFALALSIPIYGLNVFDVMAQGARSQLKKGQSLLVTLDSRKNDYFAQFYDQQLRSMGPALILTSDDIVSKKAEEDLCLYGAFCEFPDPKKTDIALEISDMYFLYREILKGVKEPLALEPIYMRLTEYKKS